MRNRILLSLFMLSSLGSLMAQTASLSGKVTETETGEPVLFCAVALYQNGHLKRGTETDFDGNYNFANLDPGTYDLEASYLGFETVRITAILLTGGKAITVNVQMSTDSGVTLEEVVVTSYKVPLVTQDNTTQGGTVTAEQIHSLPTRNVNGLTATTAGLNGKSTNLRGSRDNATTYYIDGVRVKQITTTPPETTEFSARTENRFQNARNQRFSTFGVDVDRAAYSLVRTYIEQGRIPPAEAIRTEEMINYFSYDYPQPTDQHPFAVESELGVCPWNADHLLLAVALQGEQKKTVELGPSNLTFLLDVSGSMGQSNKLPLVKSSMIYLLDQLQPTDRIAIVVYAGAAGVVLPSTPVAEKETILAALERLQSGGSTAGGAGIKLAYETARANYRVGGNNRVILATDGDFNVGVSHPDSLESLIMREKDTGVFLTALGFGMGNYKDNRLERLANKGNGMYAYIDTQLEAEKVFGTELNASLYTIAKDVKLQMRFNSKDVASYRLIGYENRLLNKEDFSDDTKDAGDIGSGHSVTALYEIVPIDTTADHLNIGRLELRYKTPEGRVSQLLKHELANEIQAVGNASDNFRWASAVTAYSLLLQDSQFKGAATYSLVLQLGTSALGTDPHQWRAAFLAQVGRTEELVNRMGRR